MKEYVVKLFLDDFRIPLDCIPYMHTRIGKMNPIYLEKDWIIVRDYEAFVMYITNNGLPDVISFDHDLAEEHYAPDTRWQDYDNWENEQKFKFKTGHDCAKWLVDYCIENKKKLPLFIVHSMNPAGTENIRAYLANFKTMQDREDQTA